MDKLEIEIQIRKTLKPSTPTPYLCRSFNLSLFDQCAVRMYIPVLLHYLPGSMDGVDERCDKLQKSLAETLTKFYPLAGRFSKDDLTIQCNDEGVEYVETKVNADLAKFLHQGPKIELLNDFLPLKLSVDPSSSPLLGVQMNIFNCGGLVMGIQMSHILADAFTLATFLKEWAHISQTGTTKGCLSSFGRLSSFFPTRVLPVSQFSPHFNSSAKIIRKRFVFDALAITELKDKIDSSATSKKPSRVVVITSLIWKVLMGISSAKHGHSGNSSLLIPINLRGKSNVPSIEHALGNFCISAISTFESNQSRKELSDFVNLIETATRETSAAIGKANIDDIVSMIGNCSTLGQKGEDIYFSTSWCRLPWYEADFGWGKPCWVSNVLGNMSRVINLIDTRTGDGIEAWVSLEENDMIEFERNLDILTFCSPKKQQLIP
ncbi:unnamed protein product [Withania somnifera]